MEESNVQVLSFSLVVEFSLALISNLTCIYRTYTFLDILWVPLLSKLFYFGKIQFLILSHYFLTFDILV